jgi:hypothetical protein
MPALRAGSREHELYATRNATLRWNVPQLQQTDWRRLRLDCGRTPLSAPVRRIAPPQPFGIMRVVIIWNSLPCGLPPSVLFRKDPRYCRRVLPSSRTKLEIGEALGRHRIAGGQEVKGVKLQGVRGGSPAEKGGLQGGEAEAPGSIIRLTRPQTRPLAQSTLNSAGARSKHELALFKPHYGRGKRQSRNVGCPHVAPRRSQP